MKQFVNQPIARQYECKGQNMQKSFDQLSKRFLREEAGITALETAIILIAFVVVASVFAFTILSAGTFSTERGKEAVYAGLSEVRSSMEVKGSVIALGETVGTTGTVDALVFTISNAVGGEPINLDDDDGDRVVIIDYRDATTTTTNLDWTLDWMVQLDDDDLLEGGELAEITVPIDGSGITLGANTDFIIEVKPQSGAVLNIQRTTPAYIEAVYDLQ
jgi:flagellin FlaB